MEKQGMGRRHLLVLCVGFLLSECIVCVWAMAGDVQGIIVGNDTAINPTALPPNRSAATQLHDGRAASTYQLRVYASEGQYLTVLRIGSPPVRFTAIVDTGSDLIWRQCKPCIECYRQSAPASTFPIFNPARSSTFRKASCSDPLCPDAQSYGGTCNPTCGYDNPYDDPPAYTRGDLAFDTLSISAMPGRSRRVSHFAFGCSHESRGPYNFTGAGGIVGFGQGKLSLPAQLGVKKFSYCFPRMKMWSIPMSDMPVPSQAQRHISSPSTTEESRGSSSTAGDHQSLSLQYPTLSHSGHSPLFLGKDAALGGGGAAAIQSTPILPSNGDPSYNIELKGISVAGRRLNISRSVFQRGGTIIDSGTTFSTLAPQAFRAVYAAFTSRISLAPSQVAPLPHNLSLCYSSLPSPMPSLSFHFRGAHVHLPTNNYFIFIEKLFCLAILEARESEYNVYGNVQQQDFHILYDLHTQLISFKPASCASLQQS